MRLSQVISDYIRRSILTTKGDLVVRGDAQPERLAAGAANTFLMGQGAGSLPAYSAIPVDAWTAPTLLNSWVNYGAPCNPAGFWIDQFRVVHLRGMVRYGSGIPSAIFLLPAGYRPPYQEVQVIISNNLVGYCAIEPGGNVIAGLGSTGWVSLDGITFRT